MTRKYDQALRPHGIKFAQMNILTVVTARGPVQPSTVADVLSLEKSTLSRNLKMLESKGWIETLPGEAGNTQLLQTTSAGAALLETAAPAWRGVQSELVSLLGDRTASALSRAANRVRDTETV